jgi:hypothetical protein
MKYLEKSIQKYVKEDLIVFSNYGINIEIGSN